MSQSQGKDDMDNFQVAFILGEVQVSHPKRMHCRYVINEKGRRKIRCSFLNSGSLELCDEDFDSRVDESDKETELDEDDEGGESGAAEVPLEIGQRAGAGVVENMDLSR